MYYVYGWLTENCQLSSLAAFTIIAEGWEYFYLCKAKNTRWLMERFVAIELSIKSHCLHPVFGPAFTLLFPLSVVSAKWEILLNLSMKSWKSAFNAQCSRAIIVVVQVGAVKIYGATVEAVREKERQDETQFTTKIGGKFSLGPSYFVL